MSTPPGMEHLNRNVIASWAVAVAQALDERGIDSRAIFASAGIDILTARDPSVRYSADQMTLVYELAEKATQDPSFGLSIAEHVHPTSLHALGYSLFASNDLESFCRRIVRYFGLVSTNAVTEAEEIAEEFHLSMLPATGRTAYAPQDAWLATLMRFSRFIYRPNFDPLRVRLRRPQPANGAERFSNWFRAPIEFGSPKNTLVFRLSDMHVRLPAANAELARQNDQVVLALLRQIDRNDIIAQVRASLIGLLPSGDCSKQAVAAQLNLSERTLQNRLVARGTTYSDLLSETRRELAEQYMNQNLHSISEVAFLLGFSEISSFSRAFRAWTGESPSSYRERSLRGDGTSED
ncbi:MAG TPA: AraC family transcriptional regulator [Woeseiaceae bacterium]|nr:AraC family transcriptional regulator [Woeseiaceae bacterium]